MKRGSYIYKSVCAGLFLTTLYACASMGNPDGGPYDETPPRFISSSPTQRSLNQKETKVTLNFDEFIKLQNASEKVIISPPQLEQAEIKSSGKHVTVELLDTLKKNTTYTIDFGDAIVDNNEGNPMGDFAFVFSTGEHIDSMEVSGTVLEAENLEPVKGMLVGLHSNLNDTAFNTIPFERVSRTNSQGKFIIRGIAPGKYRIYGLSDANQNFTFDQKSEKIAFSDSLVVPYNKQQIRQDTTWIDSLTIDTVINVEYTHYYPDDIILRAFTEEVSRHYFIKSERINHQKFTLYFSAKSDSLPLLKGLNFDEKDAFIIENSMNNDTISYWLRDSLIYYKDTLELSITYLSTVDSLDYLVERTDTLSLTTKKSRTKILEEKQKEYEEAEKKYLKEAKRKAKKEGNQEEELKYIPPTEFLKVSIKASTVMDVNNNISINFEEPLVAYNDSFIHLYQKVDTLWKQVPFIFDLQEGKLYNYILYGEWKPEEEYKIVIDSTAFKGLYGLHSNKIEQKFKFRSLDDYGVIFFDIAGTGDSAIVELLDAQGNTKRRALTEKGKANFYFLMPGKYYFRIIMDQNKNGKWDTGNYELGIQPEEVYYYPKSVEVKALWEYNQDDWNIKLPLNRQKPLEITKQKPDKDKEKVSKNEKRRQDKGR